MNSRRNLPARQTNQTGFIYKPGFVDDKDTESLKMAVDKELGLISNSFYIISEDLKTNQTDLKKLYEQALLVIQEMSDQIQNLKDRVEVLENKP